MLSPLASKTRDLLREALDQRFFSRYTDPVSIKKASYVFEMQMRLHPTFKTPEKSINRVVRACTMQCPQPTTSDRHQMSMRDAVANVKTVDDKIVRSLRELMTCVADSADAHDEPRPSPTPPPVYDYTQRIGNDSLSFSEELTETFAAPPRQPVPIETRLS